MIDEIARIAPIPSFPKCFMIKLLTSSFIYYATTAAKSVDVGNAAVGVSVFLIRLLNAFSIKV